MTKVEFNPFDKASIDAAIREIEKQTARLLSKERELRIRLAALGASVAHVQFSGAVYDGVNDVSVRVEDAGNMAVVYAEGKSVAFIEFGSGAMYGGGHPLGAELGLVPGSWSTGEEGKGHWDDPEGWYYEHDKKSWGNPPAMAMANARDEMVAQITAIAREVFSK